MLVSRDEVLMGRDAQYPLTPELESYLAVLLTAINKLRLDWGKPMIVSSGYRPGPYNVKAGGATHSPHLTCEAVDISDPDGSLDAWCVANQDKLEAYGLWLEAPASTPTWTHLDTRQRTNRIFQP